MVKINNSIFKEFMSYVIITIGVIISSYALETILIPNTILDGGVTGIGIIIAKLTPLNLSQLVFVLNIPFIYVGYRHLGKRFLFKTIYSMAVFTFFLYLFSGLEPLTDEILLATVFGGFLLGLGCGIVIKMGSCLDGTESVSMVISKKFPISIGQIILIFNIIIFGVAGFIFGIDRALYSLLTYFITYKIFNTFNKQRKLLSKK